MGGTFYGLEFSLLKSLKLDNMIPTTPSMSESSAKNDENKDFETLRRENAMIEDNSKHATKLRSACQFYTGVY
ncbi:MAG: hypothetical protein ACKO96_41250 [Flammeovirgaceae bacterium]